MEKNLHALDDGVYLMPSFRPFTLLAVEHHSVFNLDHKVNRVYARMVKANLVVQATTFWIRKRNYNILVLRLKVLTNASDGAAGS
jgi:hypothetical protein